MIKLFDITDNYSVQQYEKIASVLSFFEASTMIVYTSNWYITIACIDVVTAAMLRSKLHRVMDWDIQMSEGRRNKTRHYLKLRFFRE